MCYICEDYFIIAIFTSLREFSIIVSEVIVFGVFFFFKQLLNALQLSFMITLSNGILLLTLSTHENFSVMFAFFIFQKVILSLKFHCY